MNDAIRDGISANDDALYSAAKPEQQWAIQPHGCHHRASHSFNPALNKADVRITRVFYGKRVTAVKAVTLLQQRNRATVMELVTNAEVITGRPYPISTHIFYNIELMEQNYRRFHAMYSIDLCSDETDDRNWTWVEDSFTQRNS